MSDSDILKLLQDDIRGLCDKLDKHLEVEDARWEKMLPLVAILVEKAHSSPCEPMQKQVTALKTEQDQVKGAMRFLVFLLAVIGGAAALVAIFR